MEHFQTLVLDLIDKYGYGGLFVGMTLGNIGAPVGSEVVLPAAGALVATGHLSSVWIATAVAVAGELTGGSIGYAIGRFGGRPFVERFGKYVRFHHQQLDRVHGFFERWGTGAIFICRFVPVIRGIVAIPAGIAEMNLLAFYTWTFLGSLVFCGGLILLGNALGEHLGAIYPMLHRYSRIALGIALAAIVAGVVWAVVRSRRSESAA
ncbi:MAG: DedA family protein [Vulcanimicrobiaceae bacterium]